MILRDEVPGGLGDEAIGAESPHSGGRRTAAGVGFIPSASRAPPRPDAGARAAPATPPLSGWDGVPELGVLDGRT
jgi:hypothetical protein